MKEYIFIIIIVVIAVSFAAIKFWPSKAQAAQENYIPVAKSDFGEISIDSDSVQALKKNNRVYLSVTVEEKYTDKEFLNQLRTGENMQNVVSSLSLYVFSNDGAYYWIPNRYLVDDKGKACVDLGSVDTAPVNADETLIKIYTAALKVMENKKRMQDISGK